MIEYRDSRFFGKIEDGILFFEWIEPFADEKYIDDAIKARISLCNGKTYPMLADITKLKGGTKAARQRLADIDGELYLNALAVVYSNKVQRVLIALYNVIYKPGIPVKYFSNRRKALEWIQKYKNV